MTKCLYRKLNIFIKRTRTTFCGKLSLFYTFQTKEEYSSSSSKLVQTIIKKYLYHCSEVTASPRLRSTNTASSSDSVSSCSLGLLLFLGFNDLQGAAALLSRSSCTDQTWPQPSPCSASRLVTADEVYFGGILVLRCSGRPRTVLFGALAESASCRAAPLTRGAASNCRLLHFNVGRCASTPTASWASSDERPGPDAAEPERSGCGAGGTLPSGASWW